MKHSNQEFFLLNLLLIALAGQLLTTSTLLLILTTDTLFLVLTQNEEAKQGRQAS